MKKQLILVIALFANFLILGQDTISVMIYNLLNYGNFPPGYCDISINNPTEKEGQLRTIFAYHQPDIFAVNEIGSNTNYHDRILDSVLNYYGNSNFQRASQTNQAGSYLVNQLYYDSNKLTLQSQSVLNTYVRDINLYRLYYNSPQLQLGDTAFINCIVGHLKAGSDASDQSDRSTMTQNALINLVANFSPGNFLFMGDFNIKNSSEQSYQNLINFSNSQYKFYDPINTPGSWNNNSSYSSVHTQSTHYTSNDCAAGGGMDDRFDFILASNSILNGTSYVLADLNSYKALGQDGSHFNSSVNYQGNNIVPLSVADALYGLSDHLPVVLDLIINQQPLNTDFSALKKSIKLVQRGNSVFYSNQKSTEIRFELCNITGKRLISGEKFLPSAGSGKIVNFENLNSGIYLLRVLDSEKNVIVKKIVVQ